MQSIDTTVYSIKTRKAVQPAQVAEDDLLTEEDKAPKVARTSDSNGDCSTRRKACKNCVCGRAELEAKAEAEGKTLETGGPPPGGCGNCSRGDAFRCAGCPYRGTPGWNVAEGGKVQLTLTDDI